MNISRKLLTSRPGVLESWVSEGLGTWVGPEGCLWLGNTYLTLAYAYMSPLMQFQYYDPVDMQWLQVSELQNHPWGVYR